MANGKSSSNRNGQSNTMFVLLLVLIVVIGIVAATGMVMAVLNYTNDTGSEVHVNLGPSGGSPGDGSVPGGPSGMTSFGENIHYDEKKWTIQVNGDSYNRVTNIDRKNRNFGGYLVDVVNAVCLIAGKNCVLVHSHFSNCWNEEFPGQGILGRWYDACSLYAVSLDRLRSMKFTAPFTQTASPVFLTLPGNPMNFDPNSLSTAKIGFLNGWWSDRFCLFFSKDYDLEDSQIANYPERADALNALQNREIDAIFVSGEVAFPSGSTQIVEVSTPCLQGGNAMMTRQDSLFTDWWDPAFQTLIHSREYREICSDIEDPNVHGDKPGGNADQVCV